MDSNEEKFNIARQLHFSGRIEEAQKIYVKLLKIYKKNHTLYYLIGTTYLQLKKQDLAMLWQQQKPHSQLHQNFLLAEFWAA